MSPGWIPVRKPYRNLGEISGGATERIPGEISDGIPGESPETSLEEIPGENTCTNPWKNLFRAGFWKKSLDESLKKPLEAFREGSLGPSEESFEESRKEVPDEFQ